MKLPLTVACWDYDRTRALFDRRVEIEGCDANVLSLPVEETFFRALRSQEFDVAELSLSSYTMLRSRGASPYTAIPVFLSRMFRHSAIYVRKDRGITQPSDLVGKIVGVPEYQLTAPVWVRGILEDEYGVRPSDLSWRTGGVEQPGRHEKVALTLPPEIEISSIGHDQTLNDALVDGRIDALIAPRAPSAYASGHPMVGRLFPDFRGVEKAYYAKTGIFPTMHVVGIRNELLAQNPWLAASVLKAFTEAKNLALQQLAEVAALKVSLPWLASEYEETVGVMGKDFWRYGIAGNEATLDAFLGYHHRQGLSERRLSIADLFAESTMEQVLV
jgi:4,5-dihydroxyphthalate decarboxylase